jgi:hypothetical protein
MPSPHMTWQDVISTVGEQGRRRKLVGLTLVVATLVGLLAVFAIWAKRQVLETDSWVETSTELLEDAEIQGALTVFITDALFESVDVKTELEERLPPQAQALAGPASGGLRELANRLTLRSLQGPRIQALWEDTNRAAHETLIEVVEEDADDTVVSINVAAIVEDIGGQLGFDVAGRIPDDVATFEVLRPDELDSAQKAVNLLEGLALILPFLAFFLYGLAIYLAEGRRRETVRAVGWGFIAIGFIVLATRRAAGSALVDSLASTASVEPAVDSTWEIATTMLRDGAIAVIGYGIVIVLGAWLAGAGALASTARRNLTPVLRERRTAYAVLAAIVLLVFWWNPTEGTSRVLPSLVLIVLLVTGFEALRRQAVRDFPDETMEDFKARWAGRLRGARAASDARTASTDEQRIQQLERLARLRESGLLTDEELAAEKTRVLS